MPDFLTLENVTKRYGTATALAGISIDISKGDFVTLLGPSGSGKSTALMAIAGFVAPDEGRILFDGKDISRLAPERRGFGVVFQGYALFPHMSVASNIAYPLEVRGESRSTIADKVRRVLDLVQLQGMADRRPSMLSGGQQQRVAIARALVYEPPILLLDEPLSALDRKLRGELQAGLKALHARLGTTFVNVTHDQDEALGLSTSVVVLSGGRVMQQASPSTLYDFPETAFVADFIGSANVIALSGVSSRYGRIVAEIAGQSVTFPQRHPIADDGQAAVAIRRESLRIADADEAMATNRLPATVQSVERVGQNIYTTLEVVGVGPVKLSSPSSYAGSASAGDRVTICWRPEDGIHLRDA